MNISLLVFVLLLTPSVLGFPSVQTYPKEKLASLTTTATTRGNVFPVRTRIVTRMTRPLPEHGLQGNFMAFPASSLLVATTSFPALAATTDVVSSSVLPSALWAYGHYFSILVIMGCLTAERLIVREDMTVDDEDMIVKLDLVYGLMAALLIISGFARATTVRIVA